MQQAHRGLEVLSRLLITMHNDIMVELLLLLGQRLSIGQRIIAFWFIWFNLGCGKESALLLLLAPDLFLHSLGLEIR